MALRALVGPRSKRGASSNSGPTAVRRQPSHRGDKDTPGAEDLARSARAWATRPEAWAILVTRGHQHDERILRELKAAPPRYAGMIGSKRRVESVRKRLLAGGFPRPFLEVVHAPIGLPIGADSPLEIAVPIAAEMVAMRRCSSSNPIGVPRATLSHGTIALADSSGRVELWQDALRAGCPVVLATIVSRRGSTPRGVGAQMAILADGRTLATIGGGCGERDRPAHGQGNARR